ncbi:putative multidrug resistance protein [Podospora australis]|uniref:Multidrug resistance protein n=1 Tax=Podospora australis TaxID=1536484 RepID=A0AAN7AF99_9PEZI|nr:putative multidrug resistance protein [Podospora australis]
MTALEASEEKRPPSASSATGGDDVAEDKPIVAAPPAQQGGLFSFLKIFVSAEPTWIDISLLITGCIAAAAAGIPFPLMGIIFGELVDNLNDATCAAGADSDTSPSTSSTGLVTNDPYAYEDNINQKVLQLVYIAIAALVAIYVYVLSWSLFSQRLAQRLRAKYVNSLLKQPPSFFDANNSGGGGEVSSRLQGDMTAVQAGTSEKVGVLIASTSFFIACYVVAFIKQAKLAGILVSLVPAFLLMAMSGGFFITKYMTLAGKGNAAASNIASEALQHVSVVQAFGMATRLEKVFAKHVAEARAAGTKKGVAAAVQAGMLYFIAYSANALAFWQGSRMVVDTMRGEGTETVGQIYTVVFLLVDACVCLGNIAPILPILGGASAAFQRLMRDINAPSSIDGTSESGLLLDVSSPGTLELHNVSFAYPSRPEQPVLRNVDLLIPAGKHTALVGLSGSGKSTIAALVARLQDPVSGKITIDGHDLTTLNVRSLRSFISLVQQEPSLLDRSILENIALGLINSPKPEHAHLKDILLNTTLLQDLAKSGRDIFSSPHQNPAVNEILALMKNAAEQADADSFISALENGYGTSAGPKGSLVSGGQRQRVALARALIRDPKILLLDEATSALDSTSERKIQAAVDRAAKERTVISIAHRLSTIRNADNIVVLEAGQVVEQGSYADLMERGGAFAKMAGLQSLGSLNAAAGAGEKETAVVVAEDVTAAGTDTSSVIDEKVPVTSSSSDPTPPPSEVPSGWGAVFKNLWLFIRPSLPWLFLALISAVLVGATFSGSGLIFGFTVGALNPCENSPEDILDLGEFFGGLLFMLACIELFANFFAWSSFGLIAERLLFSVRVLSFRSLMEQGVHWHQSAGRNPTNLLDILTKDSAAIQGFSGSTIGTVFSIIVNFIVAIILSHIVNWKIAIVCLSVVPILLGAGFMQLRMLARYEERHAASYSKATGVAVEAVQAIKTVAALSLEKEVSGSYARLLKHTRDEMVTAAAFTNIWLAISNSMSFLIYAFAYWWGSQKIMSGEANQTQFFIIVVSMLVSAQLWGQMFSLAPEFSRARLAFGRIMGVINLGQDKKIDSKRGGAPPKEGDEQKDKDVEADVEGKRVLDESGRPGVRIDFTGVSFSYPSRPEHKVLDGVSFTIQPGQFVGLVGPSGAGKSTIMSLVQRLYHPTAGTVALDGLDISSCGEAFRDSVALVPQDPALFDGSVKFNVGLGARPGHEATDEEIEAACRLASIHDVITAMPEGYNTECGASASRLSGGQRQRLAIARALVRKPRLLLLDESTSALDAASEAALQEGLDRVSQGTTVLAITHRLHTVKKADVIFVVEGGKIVDSGTHAELMERRESYRVNAMQQMLQ